MSATSPTTPLPQRLASLDAFRGFALFLMGLELLNLDTVAAHFPDSSVWRTIGFHAVHIPWSGCSLHDLIQPAFSFMVGAALPFSIASRLAKGQSKLRMTLHAVWRALILIVLGIFVRSLGRPMTNWTFDDTLTQIGLGYSLLFVLGFASHRTRWTMLALILIGYWLFFVWHPPLLPHADRDAINIPPGWKHNFDGFFARWNLNRNPAWSFDVWLLNLFPRLRPYVGYVGGYTTLSFIPTLATMILGLIAGGWLKRVPNAPIAPRTLVIRLLLTGLACLGLGQALHSAGICPIVKRLWTPSWVLFSGGWCFLFMAAFYQVMDVMKLRLWAFPFVVIGMNSIAMYLLFHSMDRFIGETLHTHLGRSVFQVLGPELEPALQGAAVLLVLWLILLWMYRRGIFLRV